MISSILLAAGESRRMGEFKQLLDLGGKSFVERCTDTLLASNVSEVIIVTGHRESEVRRAIGNRPVRFIHNSGYPSGMASSIKSGVQALNDGVRACVLALVDQPQIATDVIDRLIETYEKSHPLIVIPTFEGKNGHPLLFDLALREEILSMDPDHGLREVVRSHASEIAHVEISSREILEDFDLPQDYQRLLKR